MPGDLCFYGAWDRNRENKNSLTPQTPCGGYTDTRLVKVKKREKKQKKITTTPLMSTVKQHKG